MHPFLPQKTIKMAQKRATTMSRRRTRDEEAGRILLGAASIHVLAASNTAAASCLVASALASVDCQTTSVVCSPCLAQCNPLPQYGARTETQL